MNKNRNLILGVVLIATAIIFNRFNIISGFFLGFIFGAGISLFLSALIIKIRKK